MASVSVRRVGEYGGIKSSTRWARTDPVYIGGSVAEASIAWVTLETAVDDIVNALVSTGEGDFEVSLARVRSTGGVGDDEVHTARVGGRVSIYHCAPDVEILASTAIGIGSASIALVSTRVHVIPIEEREAHVSWSIISTICWSKYEFVTVRNGRVDEGLDSISTTVLNVCQTSWWGCELLASEVGFLGRSMDVGINCTFEVGRPLVETWVVEFIVQVGEDA